MRHKTQDSEAKGVRSLRGKLRTGPSASPFDFAQDFAVRIPHYTLSGALPEYG